MGLDAVANDVSMPAAAAARDAGKKKRNNRSARLKQCKLDARREQWLSQVKNKDCKVLSMSGSPNSPPPSHPPLPQTGKRDSAARAREERDDSPLHDGSDLDSPTHEPASGNAMRKGSRAHSVSSGSSIESTSRSVSDAEEEVETDERGEENGVLDDWEAAADALSTDNDRDRPNPDPVTRVVEPAVSPGSPNAVSGRGATKPEPIRNGAPRAWAPDDAFRPRSLPSISKQRSFPVSMERRCGVVQRSVLSLPSSCPICCEDLDPTDSSFLPCLCGFRLCLFCHKRILEADGRCPGCRKQYDAAVGGAMGIGGVVSLPLLRLSRSCSMSSRS